MHLVLVVGQAVADAYLARLVLLVLLLVLLLLVLPLPLPLLLPLLLLPLLLLLNRPFTMACLGEEALVRFGLRHCQLLPAAYQAEETSRVLLAFFALGSLAVLGRLDSLAPAQRADFSDWLARRWSTTRGGFHGAPPTAPASVSAVQPGPDAPDYDTPHILHTYCALLSLAILSAPSNSRPNPASPFAFVHVPKLLEFVAECQLPDGSFRSFPGARDSDVRLIYCAAAILSIVNVKPESVIDVPSAVAFLKSCRRHEGGYGQGPYHESQGGSTYCVLASLALLNQLDSLSDQEAEETLRWLVDRQKEVSYSADENAGDDDDDDDDDQDQDDGDEDDQSTKLAAGAVKKRQTNGIGRPQDQRPSPLPSTTTDKGGLKAGFQGRPGKPLDACYSFWCVSSLKILLMRHRGHSPNTAQFFSSSEPLPPLWNPQANINFLLDCQSKQWGGLARYPGFHPDLCHNYLALASFAISLSSSPPLQVPCESKSSGDVRPQAGSLAEHDPLLNVPVAISAWVRKCFPCEERCVAEQA